MDKEEFTRIVDQYYDDVKRIAFAGCKNIYDAEDIAQTVFLKLSQYKGIFENDEHAKKWLIRVAVNEYKSLWHSPWKTKIEYNVPELASKSPGKNTVSPHNDVLDAVMSLKRKNREVIYLFYIIIKQTDSTNVLIIIHKPFLRNLFFDHSLIY